MNEWNIRKAEEEDIPFIYATWIKSYRYDSLIGKGCRNTVFYPNYNRIIDWVLDRSEVLMACHLNNPQVVFSYLVYEPDIVHYAFTKEAFLRQGICKSLWEEAGRIPNYSHKTFNLIPIMKAHPFFTFNPFILFHKYEGEQYGRQAQTTS